MKIDFIIPSIDQDLTYLAVKSFEKFKGDFDFRYIIIESTDKTHLKNEITSTGNVVWIQDESGGYSAFCENSELKSFGASTTLSIAIEKYSHLVESEVIFICDNDVVATHPKWMSFIYEKYKDGNLLVGTSITEARIFSTQKCGFLCDKYLFDNISLFPNIKNGQDSDSNHSSIRDPKKWFPSSENIQWDCGDLFHEYCKRNNIKNYTFPCSLNDKSINSRLNPPFKDFHVDRTINDNDEVFYMHLGRGMQKIRSMYSKPNRVYYDGWKNFINTHIS